MGNRPTSTSGRGRKNGKETGEDRRFECSTCGFPCKPGRDSEGGEASRTQTKENATGDEASYSETVNGGCPSCGSRAWRKNKK